MSTVDEILETGWYTDRRGRTWRRLPLSGRWAGQVIDHQGIHWAGQKIAPTQMRLLIERDQHRGECPGLYRCHFHPVPIVWRGPASGDWCVDYSSWHDTLPEAMDAARALAVGE